MVSEPTASREAWAGRYLTVTIEHWPTVGDYELIRKHHAVAVVPVSPEGDVIMVRQFRPPVRTDLTEIPAGLLDVDGEDAVTCAGRELREETGYRHMSIAFMGGVYVSPGFTDEYMHLFWARTESQPSGPPEQGIEVVRLPLHRAVAAARAGKVRNAVSALGLLLAAGVPELRDAAELPS
ncbi:MAG TPA: NUDIX hydrolase [Actinomycetota bacterium]|nr:NUDIX hydrolase [Actinomycetota bacterium]